MSPKKTTVAFSFEHAHANLTHTHRAVLTRDLTEMSEVSSVLIRSIVKQKKKRTY